MPPAYFDDSRADWFSIYIWNYEETTIKRIEGVPEGCEGNLEVDHDTRPSSPCASGGLADDLDQIIGSDRSEKAKRVSKAVFFMTTLGDQPTCRFFNDPHLRTSAIEIARFTSVTCAWGESSVGLISRN